MTRPAPWDDYRARIAELHAGAPAYGRPGRFRSVAAAEVLAAWDNPGPVPAYHARHKRRLRREWPALAGALDLLSATARNNPEPID